MNATTENTARAPGESTHERAGVTRRWAAPAGTGTGDDDHRMMVVERYGGEPFEPTDQALTLTGGLYYTRPFGGGTAMEPIESLPPDVWYGLMPALADIESEAGWLTARISAKMRLVEVLAGALTASASSTPVLSKVLADPFALRWRRKWIEAALRERGTPAGADRSTSDEPRSAAEPEAFTAFKALGSWLSADDEQIARMLGIGRTTAYSWKREGREPRAETARRVFEYHAVLDSLRRRLGASAFQLWLREGQPMRRDRLLAGELEALERDVHAVLFQRPADQRPDLAWAPEPTDASDAAAGGPPTARRAARRARRA